MSYSINLGAWNGVFAVPCSLVDRHLRLAGVPQIKVILYLLRHNDRLVEIAELASLCGISEGDAADAVRYWEQEGLIVCRGGEIAPIPAAEGNMLVPDSADTVPASAAIQAPPAAENTGSALPDEENDKAAVPKAKERIRYNYNECCEIMQSDEELRHLLNTLEEILAKNLNTTERSVFITLYKWYGLPSACIAMLVEYCRSIGKATAAYIESTGIGWVNEEINTVERVDAKIARLRAARTAWVKIRTMLEIPERAPTKKEQECSCIWVNEWQVSQELILLAYERCIGSKGKLSFHYMHGIISNWHSKGINTAQEALDDSASSAGKTSGTGMFEATYTKSDVESVLDDDWMDEA